MVFMLCLISPAKKLLKNLSPFHGELTPPLFLKNAESLIEIMQKKSMNDIAHLMDLSADLAQLNFDRYQQFHFGTKAMKASYPALLLFQGDVYQGLDAKNWREKDINYSHNHLAILSGLYGLLRPMDGIQPYRLEMGTKLNNPKGSTLYAFWSEQLTDYINEQLNSHEHPILINLASTEYFKVIQEKKLKHPVLTINFYEEKNNKIKMIGIYAKKARGLMARYMMQNQIDTIEQLKDFKEQGYYFNELSSSETHLDFIRKG